MILPLLDMMSASAVVHSDSRREHGTAINLASL
jgi:hypothetical protein